MDLFLWLEQTAIATWVRESPSIWAYPTVLFLHTLGLGILVGINAALGLRLMGFASRLPVAPIQRFFPLMWVGFWINAISGTLLLLASASTKMVTPVFWIKLVFVAGGIVTLYAIKSQILDDPLLDKQPIPPNGKILGMISLLVWAAAVTAGRLMAYLGPTAGFDF